jgi:hypothetical protein
MSYNFFDLACHFVFSPWESSDDEEEKHISRPLKKRKANIDREASIRHEFLMKDYFIENCVYTDEQFARRYRMPKSLVLNVMEIVKKNNRYFQQRPDCTGKLGLSTEQKISAAFRMLAYGISADLVDEYFRLAASTASKTLKEFCKTIVECPELAPYRRLPNDEDISRLLEENSKRGFPGMIGSLDCMHWQWKNCPSALKGQYQGKEKAATIVLEAVASHDLWI